MMTEEALVQVRDNKLFEYLVKQGNSEDDILAALPESETLPQLLENLDLRHPAAPHKLHPIHRDPRAREDFGSLKGLVEG